MSATDRDSNTNILFFCGLAFILLGITERIRYSDHVEGDGAAVLEGACKLGLEGIVSKRVNAPYRSGKRPEWIKTKCEGWRKADRERWRQFLEGKA